MANNPDPQTSVAAGLGKAVGSFQKWAKTLETTAGGAAASTPPPPLRRKVLAPPPPGQPQAESEAVAPAPTPVPPAAPIEWTTGDGSITGTVEPVATSDSGAPGFGTSDSGTPDSGSAADPLEPPAPVVRPREAASTVAKQRSARAASPAEPVNAGPSEQAASAVAPRGTETSTDTQLVTSAGGFVMPPPPRELVIPPLPEWVTTPTPISSVASSAS